MAFGNTSGTERITSDSVVISSGKPVRVFSLTFPSGGSAGVAELYNGTSKSGDVYVSLTGTANRTLTQNFEDGLLFPDGCFAALEGASTAILACRLEI